MKRTILNLIIIMAVSSIAYGLSDDFEDGVINAGLWVCGGEKRGPNINAIPPVGPWQYSHEEIIDPADGYLSVRVWGPTSGTTYGAEAWIRTTRNFNDGGSYMINFTWEVVVGEPRWFDFVHIQITDGFIPQIGSVHWAREGVTPGTEGTVDLLVHTDTSGNWLENGWWLADMGSISKATWSMTITPNGVARLYDGPNQSGSLVHEASLDPAKEWFFRMMLIDATSAGHPAGDDKLRLYSFDAHVEVDIDIKPGSCPNPLNINDKGMLPVAILGTEDLDVFTIDPASIRLADVAPIRSSFEDVATPVLDGEDECECTTEGPDGYLDLTLKFNVQDIVDALGEVNDGDILQLTLTGTLLEDFGGTSIEGADCVVIISKGGKKK